MSKTLITPPLSSSISPPLSSSISPPLSSSISPAHLTQLQEVASLMDQIYMTLAKMRYLPASAIKRPPHNINLTLAAEKELDPLVIHLHQILPYVDSDEADGPDFIFGGEFADFRDADDVAQSRDPFYSGWETYGEGKGKWDEDGGEYIRPWVTPLTMMGNHQAVIIYDARKNRIWIIDQERWSSSDYALRGVSEGKQVSKNSMNFDHIPSRPAPEVLKDIIRRYETLEEIPGGGEHSSGFFEYEAVKALYIKHGWPENFDGDAFCIDMVRLKAQDRSKYLSSEPLRQVETYTNWGIYSEIGKIRLETQIAAAKTADEKYALQWELEKNRLYDVRRTRELEEAKGEAEKLCPRGVCIKDGEAILWELRQLDSELEWKRNSVDNNRKWMNSPDNTLERTESFKKSLKKEEVKLGFVEKAYKQCKDEVERLGLIPFPPQGDFERARDSVVRQKKTIEQHREFLVVLEAYLRDLSADAVMARMGVEAEIKSTKRGIANLCASIRQHEKFYADREFAL
ncbi:hypothetical protein K432DRAFT_311150 [Lepidopterella palustris CBS 459.81]|uniref:Uncharacterized protein n=1 Tax=Lepidopterella palustris CBS 459.81 TaxID=1314670 RepID=A0A8E2DZ87_9PEZI|nr:hypothetical protein K432DRAFT_311150 [Lepidopterella palustris CBS 459.81]